MASRCKQLESLLLLYGEATEEFLACVAELSLIARYDGDLFRQMLTQCDEARKKCEELRRQVQTHWKEHACTTSLAVNA